MPIKHFTFISVRNKSLCGPTNIFRGKRQPEGTEFDCPRDCEELTAEIGGMFIGNVNLKAMHRKGVCPGTAE